jgi:glycine cleavage system T protein
MNKWGLPFDMRGGYMEDNNNFFFEDELARIDPETHNLIRLEEERQTKKIMLIASESICPKPVKEALASVFTNLYAEGYPHMRYIRDERDELLDFDRQLPFHRRYSDRRYYKGVDYVDFIEALAQKRCAELFASEQTPAERIFCNVQPLSGAAANNAVYEAFLEPGDTVMGMALDSGGHLTHGSESNRSGRFYTIVPYTVNPNTGRLDYDAIKEMAIEHQPRMIIAGYSAYPWNIDWNKFREIADAVPGGCILHADIAHTAGLVAAGCFPNPVGIADVTAFTTHKTLCGPRGAVIITTDEEKAKLVESAVFPGEQGGPHICNIAAKAVNFKIAQSEEFKALQEKIIENAQHLAKALEDRGLTLAYGGTNTHIALIDLKALKTPTGYPLTGEAASRILDMCGLTANKNAISGDDNPVHPTAIRLGTTWVTQRGAGTPEIERIAELVCKVLTNIHAFEYIGGIGTIGRGKIDFTLMEEIKREVADLERSLAREETSLDSGYPHYYALGSARERETCLRAVHENLKSSFDGFHGCIMPINYGMPESEYQAATSSGALFDLWDMGVLEITGDTDRIMPFLQQALTKDVSDLAPGQSTHSFILRGDATVMDDVQLLRLDSQKETRSRYLMLANTANTEQLKTWLRALSDGYILFDSEDVFLKVEGPITVRDLYGVEEPERLSGLALVGPKAGDILAGIAPDIIDMQPLNLVSVNIGGEDVIISHDRMGEIDSYHLFTNPSNILDLWNLILKEGAEHGIVPSGIQVRERIRKESDLPLYDGKTMFDVLPFYEKNNDLIDLDKSYFVGQGRLRENVKEEPKEANKIEYKYESRDKPVKKSCLYEEHVKLTKKIVSFAGWEMPLWYTKTSEEHQAVRKTAGLFDVSHMGVLEISGEHATRFMDFVTANYLPMLKVGFSHYSYILDPEGKVLDDVFIYRLEHNRYMMVVNAVNNDKILAWLNAVNSRELLIDRNNQANEIEHSVTIRDLKDESSGTDRRVDISLQGPNSLKILMACATDDTKTRLERLRKFEFTDVEIDGINMVISRTGYTGEEIGFEFYVHPDEAPKIWNLLLAKGEQYGIKPAGLGARDSTRTEAGFPLYGHELEGEHAIDPVEAGYGSFVRFHKPFFIGRRKLLERHLKTNRAVVRFRMKDKGIRAVRPGYFVFGMQGESIGSVTSSVLVEGLQYGLALIDKKYNVEGDSLIVSLKTVEKATDNVMDGVKGKDYEEAEVLPRFMNELDMGETPKKM